MVNAVGQQPKVQVKKQNQLVKNAGITLAGGGLGAGLGIAANRLVPPPKKAIAEQATKELQKQIAGKTQGALVALAPFMEKGKKALMSLRPKADGKAALIGTAVGAGVTVIALAAKNLMGKKQAPKAVNK